jgi:hypothetical protein
MSILMWRGIRFIVYKLLAKIIHESLNGITKLYDMGLQLVLSRKIVQNRLFSPNTYSNGILGSIGKGTGSAAGYYCVCA